MPNLGPLALMACVALGFVHLAYSFGSFQRAFGVPNYVSAPAETELTAEEVEQRVFEEIRRLQGGLVPNAPSADQNVPFKGAAISYMGEGVFVIHDYYVSEEFDARPYHAASLVEVAKSFPTYKAHFIVGVRDHQLAHTTIVPADMKNDNPQWILPADEDEWPEITSSNPKAKLTKRAKRMILSNAGFLISNEQGLEDYERFNAKYRK